MHTRSAPPATWDPALAGWDAALTEPTLAFARQVLQAADDEPTWWADCEPRSAQRETSMQILSTPEHLDVLLEVVARQVQRRGVNTRSPRYLGYLPTGGLYPAALGDFLASVLTPYSGLASLSPGAVELERTVVTWMCRAVGLPAAAFGTLTSGGSTATATAVVAAREHHRLTGSDLAASTVYVGEHAHVSLDRALRFAGLGECPVRRVPSDADHRMDVAALRQLMARDTAGGMRPFLVAATAGTTSSGAIDPLSDVAAVARRHQAWFHVDGAYGALFALVDSARARLQGLGSADSLVVDPHKCLFVAYGTGALLVRDRALLSETFSQTADYLPGGAGSDSPADLGLELTRPFRALGLWLALRLAGTDSFAAALGERLVWARHLHEQLARVPWLEVGPEPDLAIVTFRVRPLGGDPDAANTELLHRLREGGEIFVSGTVLDGRVTVRVAIGSSRTRWEDVEQALRVIVAVARQVVDGTGEQR